MAANKPTPEPKDTEKKPEETTTAPDTLDTKKEVTDAKKEATPETPGVTKAKTQISAEMTDVFQKQAEADKEFTSKYGTNPTKESVLAQLKTLPTFDQADTYEKALDILKNGKKDEKGAYTEDGKNLSLATRLQNNVDKPIEKVEIKTPTVEEKKAELMEEWTPTNEAETTTEDEGGKIIQMDNSGKVKKQRTGFFKGIGKAIKGGWNFGKKLGKTAWRVAGAPVRGTASRWTSKASLKEYKGKYKKIRSGTDSKAA